MVPQCETTTTTKPPLSSEAAVPSEPFDRELVKGGNGGGRNGGGGNTAVEPTATVAAEPVEDDPTDTCNGVTCESGYVCDSTVGFCKADEGTSCELCSFAAPCDASQQLSCVPANPKRTACGSRATCQRIATTTVATTVAAVTVAMAKEEVPDDELTRI